MRWILLFTINPLLMQCSSIALILFTNVLFYVVAVLKFKNNLLNLSITSHEISLIGVWSLLLSMLIFIHTSQHVFSNIFHMFHARIQVFFVLLIIFYLKLNLDVLTYQNEDSNFDFNCVNFMFNLFQLSVMFN